MRQNAIFLVRTHRFKGEEGRKRWVAPSFCLTM